MLIGCESKTPIKPITVALNIWPGYGTFFIAREKGFFDEEDVKVVLEIIQDDAQRQAALLSKKVDGIGMTIDNLVILRDKGIPVKAIFKYDSSYGADGIVAKKSVKTIADLKGKTVGFAAGTPSHYFLLNVLLKNGLSSKDIEHVQMSSDDAGAAFAAGKLDVAVTWEPWLSKAKGMTDGHLLISTKENPVVEDVLFLNEEILRDRPEDVKKMLKACFKAIEYWKKNWKEGNEIIAKALEIPVTDIEGMLEGIKIIDFEGNKQFFGTSENPGPVYDAYRDVVKAWLDAGILKTNQNPKDGIDSSFINSL